MLENDRNARERGHKREKCAREIKILGRQRHTRGGD